MGNTKKTKATKQGKKIKRPSFTDSEKSGESSQSVVKKKVKKRKIVLESSDEDDSPKDIAINGLFLQSFSLPARWRMFMVVLSVSFSPR